MQRYRASHFKYVVCGGVVLRFLVAWLAGGLNVSPWDNALSGRHEITPPNNSFRRLSEAFFLQDSGHWPYSGDVFHGSPLVFLIFYPLRNWPLFVSQIVLILADVFTAICIRKILRLEDESRTERENDLSDAICEQAAKVDERSAPFEPVKAERRVFLRVLKEFANFRESSHSASSEEKLQNGDNAQAAAAAGTTNASESEDQTSPSKGRWPDDVSIFDYRYEYFSEVVAACLLLNPISILSCAGMTTLGLTYAAVSLAMLCACHGTVTLTAISLAVGIVLDVYPVLLLIPLSIVLAAGLHPTSLKELPPPNITRANLFKYASPSAYRTRKALKQTILDLGKFRVAVQQRGRDVGADHKELQEETTKLQKYYDTMLENKLHGHLSHRRGSLAATSIHLTTLTAAFTMAILYICANFLGSWSFLTSSYGFSFRCQDMQPNIGMYWYFFIEIFDQFREFFLFVFHGIVLTVAGAVTVRFWREPLFMANIMISLSVIFRTYPGVGDTAFMFVAMLAQQRLMAHVSRGFIHLILLLQGALLGLLTWFMWIHPGSGNANYFFNTTLIYLFSSCSLVISAMVSARKIFFGQKLLYLWARDPRVAKYCKDKLLTPPEALEAELEAVVKAELEEASGVKEVSAKAAESDEPISSESGDESEQNVDGEASTVHRRR